LTTQFYCHRTEVVDSIRTGSDQMYVSVGGVF